MRGGEPLADGVNEAMPKARLYHAKKPEDIVLKQLAGHNTVLLVDVVINTGKSVAEMITRVDELDKDIRIILLAGVIQADAITHKEQLHCLGKSVAFTVNCLRTSATKFVVARVTDTGIVFSTPPILIKHYSPFLSRVWMFQSIKHYCWTVVLYYAQF
jgi:hypothetical protein